MDTSSFIVNLIRKSVHQLVKRSQDDPEPLKDDDTTNSLCSAIEAIFLNGQEEAVYRKMLTRFRIGSQRQPYECCFWEYLQYYLPKQLSNMILHSRIQEKRTPIGCCRAWVRVALNEATICNFLEAMICDSERTSRFYKSTSLLRDADRMEATLGLLRVLVLQCSFDLDYVSWELNSWNKSTALSLANVHYVVPTITPLRDHNRPDGAGRRPSHDNIRPSSLSNPESMSETGELTSKINQPVKTVVETVDGSASTAPEDQCGDIEQFTTALQHEEPDAIMISQNEESTITESTTESSIEPAHQLSSATKPVPVHAATVTNNSNSTDLGRPAACDSTLTEAVPRMPSSDNDSMKDQPLSSMQVADELPASPLVAHYPLPSVASMSSSDIIAEAVRRGLLVSVPVELSDSYMQTLIRAIEEHRRVEREEALESFFEKTRGGLPHSPMLSGDDTSLASSWDKHCPDSSASEVALPQESPPVMLDHENDDDDDFAVFPRRRSRLESSSGDFQSTLITSCSVPNLITKESSTRPGAIECMRPAQLQESSSLSNSWNRSVQGGRGRGSMGSPTPSLNAATEVTTPQSEGILDRIYANFPKGRRGSSSSLIVRLGSGLMQSASRLRNGASPVGTNSSKQELMDDFVELLVVQSDEEWEIVGDEFLVTKNKRCTRLLELHPGSERIPDPNHDFADTNCARCRGHIIGRSRRLDNYDGRWYCCRCHEGALSYIPRRIIYNWDFTPQVVSNETKVVLTRLFLQPNIDVMKTNPDLYTLCPELREVTRVRRQLAFLWQYVIDCPSGVARDMSRMLIPRERLIGTIPEIHLYSLEDLTLIHHGGALLKLVHHVLKLGLTHVWSCSECQTSRPHYCDRCGERVPLYEIDIYYKCVTATCDNVIHKRCFAHFPDDFMCLVCTRKKENKVPLHETYDAVFVD